MASKSAARRKGEAASPTRNTSQHQAPGVGLTPTQLCELTTDGLQYLASLVAGRLMHEVIEPRLIVLGKTPNEEERGVWAELIKEGIKNTVKARLPWSWHGLAQGVHNVVEAMEVNRG